MSFLDTTNQYCSDSDNFTIVPWKFEDNFVKPWDEVAEACRYRKFVNAKSAYASRKRLSTIFCKNAALLGGSKRTSMEVLKVRFLENWIHACDYIREHHKKGAEGMEIFGKQMSITMGCWQFLEPDLKAVVHLAGLRCGDPDALATLEEDKERRQRKAQLCRSYEAASREFVQRLVYLTGDDNTKLERLFDRAITSLAELEDEASWESG